jgi:hypothetical protein
MVLRLEVVDPDDMTGKVLTLSYSLVDKELPKQRLKSLVNACGVEYDRGGFDMDDLVGTHFTSDVTIEEWQGREFNRLENVGPFDAFGEEGGEQEEEKEPPRRTARTAPSRRGSRGVR